MTSENVVSVILQKRIGANSQNTANNANNKRQLFFIEDLTFNSTTKVFTFVI